MWSFYAAIGSATFYEIINFNSVYVHFPSKPPIFMEGAGLPSSKMRETRGPGDD